MLWKWSKELLRDLNVCSCVCAFVCACACECVCNVCVIYSLYVFCGVFVCVCVYKYLCIHSCRILKLMLPFPKPPSIFFRQNLLWTPNLSTVAVIDSLLAWGIISAEFYVHVVNLNFILHFCTTNTLSVVPYLYHWKSNLNI